MRPTLISGVVVSLFLVHTTATPLQLKRAIAVEGYVYAGCHTEATSGRALTGKAYYDDLMTTEKCAAACAGYAWFGTEYGREVSLEPAVLCPSRPEFSVLKGH